MSHEITLEQAAERAHQAEIIAYLIGGYPHQMANTDLSSIATLLARLSGDVTNWLVEELADREAKA